jgi:guanylate kinase
MLLEKQGLLIVVSGPAGSGKGTVVSHLLNTYPDAFFYSVSATTRAPRVGEEHGKQYYFITKEDFEKRIAEGQMLEYAQYCGNYYGTPKQEILDQLAQGRNVILEIEVQGALRVKELMPQALLVMILPPDYQTLQARLRGRGTNTEEDIQNRLARAKEELELIANYDYLLPNENQKSDVAAERLYEIVKSEGHRISRNPNIVPNFFKEA